MTNETKTIPLGNYLTPANPNLAEVVSKILGNPDGMRIEEVRIPENRALKDMPWFATILNGAEWHGSYGEFRLWNGFCERIQSYHADSCGEGYVIKAEIPLNSAGEIIDTHFPKANKLVLPYAELGKGDWGYIVTPSKITPKFVEQIKKRIR
jgi:hypothetical protein